VRVGHNPARFIKKVAQPAGITVAVVNCIPFLSGYYEQSLEVLKVVVESLHATRETSHPYDVMVFDNHSCAEVREFLQGASQQGKIQYLVLSDTNIGKIGAWNFIFSASQGKYVVFADGDIGFRSGWLKASLELFEMFPKVGMVTARPLRSPMEYSSATLDWARQQTSGVYEEGQFLDWECYWEHAQSTGFSKEKAQAEFPKGLDHRLTFRGKTAFVGATHFQFMARTELLKLIVPLPSEQPMRGERALDLAVNDLGYMRLSTDQPYIWHMGNTLSESNRVAKSAIKSNSFLKQILWLPFIRRPLLWINNQIFRLYFFNVK
jgi:glycosyltransferase involved in cell wall biosynthesis